MRLFVVIAVLMTVACAPVIEEPSGDSQTPIVVVVTATPTSTPILPTPTPVQTFTPVPTPVPTFTPTPSPTAISVDDILNRVGGLMDEAMAMGTKCDKLLNSGTCGHIDECEKTVSLIRNVQDELALVRGDEKRLAEIMDFIFSDETENIIGLYDQGVVGDGPIDITGMDLPQALKEVSVAVPAVITDDGIGSGALISDDGVIVTNAHVVGDKIDVMVRFERGCEYRARVVERDVDRDIALLKMHNAPKMNYFRLNRDRPRAGEDVLVFGYPLGNTLGKSVKMTRGTIQALLETKSEPHVRLVQTDAVINRGNSGGPMLNMNGEVVGIVTQKYSGFGVEGIGLQSQHVKSIYNKPRRHCGAKRLLRRCRCHRRRRQSVLTKTQVGWLRSVGVV